MAPAYSAYKSPYGPKYYYQPHVAGITQKTLFNAGIKAGMFGGVALFTVIFFASGIPPDPGGYPHGAYCSAINHRCAQLLTPFQKVPFLRNQYINEIPASDNTMETAQLASHGLTVPELFKGLAIAFILSRLLVTCSTNSFSLSGLPSPSLRAGVLKTIGFFALFLAARVWLSLVSKHVPEPYLDEVFHIPQAQTYCEGRFWDWDDKITTPPGLLRYNNLLATLLTALLAAQCRHLIEVRAAEREGKPAPRSVSFYSFHTGLNIALFPVIFFFSALYYTDVFSTLIVLVAYRNHLSRVSPQRSGLVNDIWTVVLGVAALFMRQTNVFWVVVYMGGLEAMHVLRGLKPGALECLKEVYDPPLNQSGPEDWLFCVLTLAAATICNPLKVLRQVWPHITVLALFASFVAWNGGVVLGDKSNHVATIHLSQMLYIWPLFAFFSAPLFLPSIFSAITHPHRYLYHLFRTTSLQSTLITTAYLLLTTLLSLSIIKYNTIIHPFTLADNRHYMFYIFRYTILRSPAVRLSLVAVYTLCRWLAWDTLAGAPSFPTTSGKLAVPKSRNTAQVNKKTPPTTNEDCPPLDSSSYPPSTSKSLLFLLTTTLSLITAPLVEPRYFILPWVFYRLLVPASPILSTSSHSPDSRKGDGAGVVGSVVRLGRMVDVRLVLETVWFVMVNVGTMYVFLERGFYWRGEDGKVADGGRVQRFMW
ncbi:glucosyltransferase [Collariella sp. IMI 366227]|nr:glucosyltransferase [Collariella sp. IMI 366227]